MKSSSKSIIIWVAAVLVAVVVSVVGWILGDLGLLFPGFLVRWIVPVVILVGLGSFRSRRIKKREMERHGHHPIVEE